MGGIELSGARARDALAAGLALARLAEHKPSTRRLLERSLDRLEDGKARLAAFHAVTAARLVEGRRGWHLEIALTAAEGSRRLLQVSLEQARLSVPRTVRGKLEALAEDSLRLALESEAMLRFMAADPRLVEHGGRRFRLRAPLEVQVTRGPAGWTLEVERLGIHAYGATFQEARAALTFDFCAAWDDLALEDDQRLAPDALDLKAALLALVESVEQ